MNITMYTDGSCLGNGKLGNGGWACVLQCTLPDGSNFVKEHSGGFKKTTNNRMELAAVIYGLSFIKEGNDVTVYSDSKYVCNAFNEGWLEQWKMNGFKHGAVANIDMWNSLMRMVTLQNSVKFVWVKGHASNKYNNRCDELAKAAAVCGDLQDDTGYSGENK